MMIKPLPFSEADPCLCVVWVQFQHCFPHLVTSIIIIVLIIIIVIAIIVTIIIIVIIVIITIIIIGIIILGTPVFSTIDEFSENF